MTRILVLDSSSVFRVGITEVIHAEQDLRICLSTGDPVEARNYAMLHRPELFVLDLELRRGDGLEFLRELSRLSPGSRALVFTHQKDPQSLRRAFKNGARAFISKYDESGELINGIREVIQGKLFASRAISDIVLEFLMDGIDNKENDISALSDRELQVFRMLGNGSGPKAISLKLGISIKTIETHQSRIKEKLKAKSGEELRRIASQWVSNR